MVKMISLMLCVIYSNKKKRDFEEIMFFNPRKLHGKNNDFT